MTTATRTTTRLQTITDDQVKLLAERLVDKRATLRQIRSIAFQMFRSHPGANIYERLRNVGCIFECGECDLWLPVACEATALGEMCNDCDYRLNFS